VGFVLEGKEQISARFQNRATITSSGGAIVLIFTLLRLRYEVSASRLNGRPLSINLYFKAMKATVCLHALDGKFEDVDDFWCLRDGLEPRPSRLNAEIDRLSQTSEQDWVFG